jgi:predicted metal-dependent hydrolase
MPGQWKKTDRLIGIMSDHRFVAFILYFNRDRDYYECHEVMEELWLEEGRSSLLQGLLQAAVGLHHWDNGNRSGAAMLMNAAQDKLQGYEDVVLGLDLVDLRKNLSESLKAIANSPDTAPFRSFKLIILDKDLLQTVEKAGGSAASPE